MTFTPHFLDEIRVRQPLSDIIGKRVRLVRKGREHVGLCPFHKEKTPSFTVNEDKGFYHCFGCGAHGDVIGFVMRTDNLTFPEAVERLALAAGLALPTRTPEDREKGRERTSLYAVLERACAWFEEQLAGDAGRNARDYLARRGLDAETIGKFRLGWAPNSRHALKRALVAEGIGEAMLVGAGLLVTPDDGGASYDRFRGRIVFPITDRGDRVVAFGGRALGDGTPKYLNSPETSLFHKGAMLYGLALARQPAREAGEVIVAEGYMDVIALHRAGFANAVAPLGTALTEDQIRELWRLAPEPIICFDGDAAGQRAAQRAVERVLPLLGPGRSLHFAALPPGDDPDSVMARDGAQAMRKALAGARPLVDMLWRMESADRKVDTPERRAALQKRIKDGLDRIADATVRGHYSREFRSRLWRAFRDARPPSSRSGGRPARAPAMPAMPERAVPDSLGHGGEGQDSGSAGVGTRRERQLIDMIIEHPRLLDRVEEEFAALDIATPELDRLRWAVLETANREPGLDSAGLKNHLSTQGFSSVVRGLTEPREWDIRRVEDRYANPEVPLSDLEHGWRHILSRHRDLQILGAELQTAYHEYTENETDEALARVNALSRRYQEQVSDSSEFPDDAMTSEGKAEFDTVTSRLLRELKEENHRN